jgi:hypothetical protein
MSGSGPAARPSAREADGEGQTGDDPTWGAGDAGRRTRPVLRAAGGESAVGGWHRTRRGGRDRGVLPSSGNLRADVPGRFSGSFKAPCWPVAFGNLYPSALLRAYCGHPGQDRRWSGVGDRGSRRSRPGWQFFWAKPLAIRPGCVASCRCVPWHTNNYRATERTTAFPSPGKR